MEDDGLGIGVVILGQDHLLLDVRTTHRRAVAVTALQNLPGADAMNPGDFVRVPIVRRAQDLALVGPGGAQQPFEVQARHHILQLPVAVVAPELGSNTP